MPRLPVSFALCAALACAAQHTGAVRAADQLIPGATVTARHGATKVVAYTGEDGRYTLELAPGIWDIDIEMFGFTPLHSQITITNEPLDRDWTLQVPRIAGAPVEMNSPLATGGRGGRGGRGGQFGGRGGRFGGGQLGGRGGFGGRGQPGQAPQNAQPQNAANQPSQPNQPASGRGGAQQPAFQNVTVTATEAGAQDLAAAGEFANSSGDPGADADESFMINGSTSGGLGAAADEQARRDRLAGRGGGPGGILGASVGDVAFNGILTGGGADSLGMGAFGSAGANTGFGADTGGGLGLGPGAPGGFGGAGFGGAGGGGGGGGGGRGGRGGGAGGGRGGRGARGGPGPFNGQFATFGNRRRDRPTYHGSFFGVVTNSALNAAPFSLNGEQLAKPSSASERYGFNIGGPLRIPKLVDWERANIYFNYTGNQSRSARASSGNVPTAEQLGGNFSDTNVEIKGVWTPVTIFDPNATTPQPFPGNRIPITRFAPEAVRLLASNLFPQPTFPDSLSQNYAIAISTPSASNSVSLRTVMPLPTNRDSINFNVQYQANHSTSEQLFGFKDTSGGYGMSATSGWSHSFKPRLNNNATFAFSRNIARTTPYFANNELYQPLGLSPDQSPLDWGPPSLSFTNFSGLSDGVDSSNRSQTSNFTDTITYVMQRKHNLSFGFGYRRMQQNALSYANSRGAFSFSGLLTTGFDANGQPLPATGFDFADFLLGFPQSSSIRTGNSNNYFRGWATNWYAQDDFRVKAGLTLNFGIRYEYFSPFTERYGHIANLVINPDMTVTRVTPGMTGVPSSLINPDPNNFSPRLGFAFRPSQKRSLIFRGGYSIFYSGSPYGQIAAKLAAQPPAAATVSLSTTVSAPLTLENGFPEQPPGTITNTWAIDRNYKLGYAQTWSFAIQQTLPSNTIVELEYIGTKGTGLGVQLAPNQAIPGSSLNGSQQFTIANAENFLYQTDWGNSIFHAGQVRLTRRFSRGMSFTALYTFSKSIDDASSFTGLGGSVVQNPLDLSADRGLSTFDQRNRFSLTYTLSSPVGIHGFWRNGWKTRAFSGWTLNGNFTANSGMPSTALVGGNLTNSKGNGAVGQLRADATGESIDAGNNLYFNLLAFTTPPAGQYGNAGVDTIPGIFTTSLNATINRAWRLGESGRETLQLRLATTNALNHVQITSFGTTVNSNTYGVPTAASATRAVTLTMRFSF